MRRFFPPPVLARTGVPHISILRCGIARTSSSRFLVPLFLRSLVPYFSHQGKQNHIANRLRAGQQHHEAIDADAFAARRRQSIGQRAHVIFVHLVRLFVAVSAIGELLLETLVLLHRIVQLAEGVAELKAAGEDLESLDVVRVVGLLLRERRDFGWIVVDEGRLHELWLD